MKTEMFLGISFFLAVAASSCKQQSSNDNEVVSKHVSELTYLDVFMLTFEEGAAGGMDFHGESFGLIAQHEVEITSGSSCIHNDCGTVQMLKNNNLTREIEVAIRASFELPNNPVKEIYRYYLLPADTAVSIGCSNICYGGKTYPVQREINSAGYKTN